jgi:hypothetical protein
MRIIVIGGAGVVGRTAVAALDVLINNAGAGIYNDLVDTSVAESGYPGDAAACRERVR